MSQFNVVIAKDGMVVAVSQAPLTHGIGLGYNAYKVEAADRNEAKQKAKERLTRGDKSDTTCWS